MSKSTAPATKRKTISYAKWGYLFIAPFFVVFILFQLIPLINTFYNSLFENYRIGLQQVGPNFVGFDNYAALFSGGEFLKYTENTMIMWVLGFVPQITVAMLLAVWFTSSRLNLRGQRFFKTVIYMPNLIMASAMSMLFFMLFSPVGPINQLLLKIGWLDSAVLFFDQVVPNRLIIAFLNFLLWFGNTTILLMAGIMGIDGALFESAQIDGAGAWKVFTKVTLPLLMPIVVYTMITALLGGLQMFDVPQVISKGLGTPDRTSMTLIMYLNRHLASKNLGMGGAISVIIFIVSATLSAIVYSSLMKGQTLTPYRRLKVKKRDNTKEVTGHEA